MANNVINKYLSSQKILTYPKKNNKILSVIVLNWKETEEIDLSKYDFFPNLKKNGDKWIEVVSMLYFKNVYRY